MAYPALAIANYFIERAAREPKPIDHLTVQKLVYIAHGWHLAVFDKPLLRERVEAWKYGPVIGGLYDELKMYGTSNIADTIPIRRGLRLHWPRVSEDDEETRELLDQVWEEYKDFSGIQLSNLTHDQGTPWFCTWEKSPRRNARIDNDIIKEHFLELWRHGEAAAGSA